MVSAWVTFIKERFNPLLYLPVLLAFSLAHSTILANVDEEASLAMIFMVVTAFFFGLRVLDDIKDYETDKLYFPDRPLPRGVLKKKEALAVAIFSFVFSFGFLLYYKAEALWFYVAVALYLLLMYKEFFISTWLRKRIATYAISHTFVVVLLSIAIFLTFISDVAKTFSMELILFAIAGWFIFNVFEFGRKTFASEEEKTGVLSYSKTFGRTLAIFLTFISSSIASILLIFSAGPHIVYLALPAVLFLIGNVYVLQNRAQFGKVYRSAAFIYIVLIYISAIIINI